ncbi:MAG: IMP cyclohydrolase [Patescibacteria group bacterium]|jgi:phosphoribosylaminoimidazolecarboxamide formyltransferase/IMP cyclohydrolase
MPILSSPIKRALISLTDKTGAADLALALQNEFGVEILSTGGTSKALREAGVSVLDVSNYTGSPEILGGRVKTLHPKIAGGILNIRGNEAHEADKKKHGINNIDLVVCNLYEFEKTVAQPRISVDEAIESIDIGGVTLIRAAYKSVKDVTIIVDPADYPALLAEMKNHDGATTPEFKVRMATKAVELTAKYEIAISNYFQGKLYN